MIPSWLNDFIAITSWLAFALAVSVSCGAVCWLLVTVMEKLNIDD